MPVEKRNFSPEEECERHLQYQYSCLTYSCQSKFGHIRSLLTTEATRKRRLIFNSRPLHRGESNLISAESMLCPTPTHAPRVGANTDGPERELSDSGFNSRPRVGANDFFQTYLRASTSFNSRPHAGTNASPPETGPEALKLMPPRGCEPMGFYHLPVCGSLQLTPPRGCEP